MRKVFLEELPLRKEGIDWQNSVGYKIKFIYNDIEGYLYINACKIINGRTILNLSYKDKKLDMNTSNLRKCYLGNLIGKITKDFKFKIGQNFKDEKRNLEIINTAIKPRYDKIGKFKCNDKYYKYHCNRCGAELWMIESSLSKGIGCACCCETPRTVIKGINDISTTNAELVKYFVNIEDCYKYTIGSGEKVFMKCPNCGAKKYMTINKLGTKGFSCPKCSDGISYPEKIMSNLLQQLNIDFVYQYTSKHNKWCKNYRYDFYFKLNNEEYIVETNGIQHYEYTGFKRTLEEEQQNDLDKYNLAVNNGIKPENYIVIDCRKSDLNFIRSNILNSKLNEIFDLSDMDWIKIGQDSEKSLVKEVCDYWHLHNDINNEELTVKELSNKFKMTTTTIRNYLKKGNKIGWCVYKNILKGGDI